MALHGMHPSSARCHAVYGWPHPRPELPAACTIAIPPPCLIRMDQVITTILEIAQHRRRFLAPAIVPPGAAPRAVLIPKCSGRGNRGQRTARRKRTAPSCRTTPSGCGICPFPRLRGKVGMGADSSRKPISDDAQPRIPRCRCDCFHGGPTQPTARTFRHCAAAVLRPWIVASLITRSVPFLLCSLWIASMVILHGDLGTQRQHSPGCLIVHLRCNFG